MHKLKIRSLVFCLLCLGFSVNSCKQMQEMQVKKECGDTDLELS